MLARAAQPKPAPRAVKSPARTEAKPPAFRWAPGERERVSLLPIRHDDIWAIRKKIEGLIWTAQEVDLSHDKKDWTARMTPDERHFVKFQLAFFSRADIDVVDNIGNNLCNEVDCFEAKGVYAAQGDQEFVHAESYALQIEAVMTGAERDETLNAVATMPVIAKMRTWALRWADRDAASLGERLVAWVFVEGVLFQGPFCALQWLRERNLLPGITAANEFIMRDEGIHTDFGGLLVRKYLIDRPTPARVAEIFLSGMALVDEHVAESLPSRLIGMNDALMKQHIRSRADSVLAGLGYAPLFHAKNPFPFMDKLFFNTVSKTNFFEHTGSAYQNVTREGAMRLAVDGSPVVY